MMFTSLTAALGLTTIRDQGRDVMLLTRAFAVLFAATMLAAAPNARAADPIKIGLSVSLTGGVAANGKQVLLAMQIWKDDINAKGGLLGRPVELVYYDDQSSPAAVA